MIQRKSPYRTPSNPYGCKNQAGFLRQAQSSALREEVASISVFASAWILASAHILDRPCSNYAGNLSHGEPSANPQRKTVVYWYLWGLFPIFVLGPPRPTNNSHDLKSTSGNDRIFSVTRSWKPFYGEATTRSARSVTSQQEQKTLHAFFHQRCSRFRSDRPG